MSFFLLVSCSNFITWLILSSFHPDLDPSCVRQIRQVTFALCQSEWKSNLSKKKVREKGISHIIVCRCSRKKIMYGEERESGLSIRITQVRYRYHASFHRGYWNKSMWQQWCSAFQIFFFQYSPSHCFLVIFLSRDLDRFLFTRNGKYVHSLCTIFCSFSSKWSLQWTQMTWQKFWINYSIPMYHFTGSLKPLKG